VSAWVPPRQVWLPPSRRAAFSARRNYQRKKVPRYREERLVECLQACDRELGRPPMVRGYIVWREDKLVGGPGKRARTTDIPHHRTFYGHYDSWDDALAAGLDGSYAIHVSTTTYSSLKSTARNKGADRGPSWRPAQTRRAARLRRGARPG
jgi:hypothetical protein